MEWMAQDKRTWRKYIYMYIHTAFVGSLVNGIRETVVTRGVVFTVKIRFK